MPLKGKWNSSNEISQQIGSVDIRHYYYYWMLPNWMEWLAWIRAINTRIQCSCGGRCTVECFELVFHLNLCDSAIVIFHFVSTVIIFRSCEECSRIFIQNQVTRKSKKVIISGIWVQTSEHKIREKENELNDRILIQTNRHINTLEFKAIVAQPR